MGERWSGGVRKQCMVKLKADEKATVDQVKGKMEEYKRDQRVDKEGK